MTTQQPNRNHFLPESAAALPPGTWVVRKGVRIFIPHDPTWSPPDPGFGFDPTSVLALATAAPPISSAAHRHICDCGCLLFGIENCPQCEWLALTWTVAA